MSCTGETVGPRVGRAGRLGQRATCYPSADPLLVLLPLVAALAQQPTVAAPPIQDTTRLVWADFSASTLLNTLPTLRPIAMAEVTGDVSAEPLSIQGGMVRIQGQLGRSMGSQWSTLGLELGLPDNAAPINLSRFSRLRIRLAADAPRNLRIRLKGPDPAVQQAGCYPVLFQRIGPAEELDIPLAGFAPEPYCGPRGATISQTLEAVVSVEVTLNDPAQGPLQLEVGHAEFIAEPESPLAAATPVAPAVQPVARSMPVGLVWTDDFDAPAGQGLDRSRWHITATPQGEGGAAHDGRGFLHLFPPFELQTHAEAAILFGRVELRARLPRQQGWRVALRGQPLTPLPWPEDGEIVIAESDARGPEVSLSAPGFHMAPTPLSGALPAGSDTEFHTFSVEWDDRQMSWKVDDQSVKTLHWTDVPESTRRIFTASWPFVLRLDAADGSPDTPVLIDSVKIYQSPEQAAAAARVMATWKSARWPADSVARHAPPSTTGTFLPPTPTPTASRPKPAPARRTVVEAQTPVPRVVTCERNKFGLMMCY